MKQDERVDETERRIGKERERECSRLIYFSGNRYIKFFELVHANEITPCYRKPFVRATLNRLLPRYIYFIKNDFMELI